MTPDDIRLELGLNRVLAHQVIFEHRHRDKTPDFHKIMIDDWHGMAPAVLTMAFRGGAKSTIAEEAIAIMAIFREFKNGLILGETFDRASERLGAIAHEFETNEVIAELFGDLRGPKWSVAEGEIVLSNGSRIKAMGRGEKIRGIKFHDMRPDIVFVDDLEDEDSVRTAVLRKKTKIWFTKVMMPALDPQARIRVAATPLDADALAMDLKRDPSFITRVFPIEYIDEKGARAPQWPGRFDIDHIERIKARFLSRGLRREYDMEYLCMESTDADKAFTKEHFRWENRVRTWEPVFCMFDPARTVGSASATTGFVAWSWIGAKLVVWESWARRLMPSEIIDEVFNANATFDPVWVAVEEDGLNEWLMQPIRQRMAASGTMVPLKAVRAPRGKLDFIRGLQPFFAAREVWFNGKQEDLERQLLAFPTGEIDAPNALAYALRLRAGVSVYDGFGVQHVAQGLRPTPGIPVWLALGATGSSVTGVLCQVTEGALRIFASYVREGDPGAQLLPMVQSAQMDAGRGLRLCAGAAHFDRFNNVGLVQAAKRLPMEVRTGVASPRGRALIREMMKRENRGVPCFRIDAEATWALRGFAAGFAFATQKAGTLAAEPEDGPYRTLLEGLESFVGLLDVISDEDDTQEKLNYAYTADGRRYVSALVRKV